MIVDRRVPPPTTSAMVVVAALLEQRTGQQISSNRSWRIETALKPLLRTRGLPTLEALVDELLRDPNGLVAEQIVDALLNQETSFFRDAPVFEALLMAMSGYRAEGRRPRIWSAACSSGQEPLSLAMLLAEQARSGTPIEAEIVATDVSEAILARARAGRYSQFEIQRGLSVRRMIDWFEAIGPDWIARPELVNRITFRRHNLVSDPAPPGRFDIVLCRNVMLYLSPALRRSVLDRIAQVLRPGGLLVLGAGETVIGHSEAFVPSARYKGLYEPESGARAAA